MGRFCRTILLISALSAAGCATHPQPLPTPVHAGAFGWEGRANLTLDQVNPTPRLKAPATEPTDRAPIESLVLYGQARDATVHGQPQQAIDLLERAIALDPYRFAPRYDLGWAYVNAGGGDENAIAAFEKAAILQPDNIDLQTELGRLYLNKSNLSPAIDHLRLATQTTGYSEDDGKAAVVDFFLARALKDAGYDRAALNQYSTLVNRFAHPSLTLQENSELAYLLDRPDSLFVEIGELLEKHGEYADAVKSFRPAVDRQPDNFQLQARFARDLAMDGQREPAINKAVDLIVRNRASSASIGVLRDVCRDLNLTDGVVTTLRKLSADRPGDQAVLFALTDTLISRNRMDQARGLLESAWNKTPADVPLTRRLFAMDKQQDRTNSAALLLIHGLMVNPDALHNYEPLWSELFRPGQKNRLTLESVLAMRVTPVDEASRLYWVAVTAAADDRPIVQRTSLQAATHAVPPLGVPFAPAYVALLNLDWERPDLSLEQKITASDQLAALAKSAGDPALSAELAARSLVHQQKWSLSIDQFANAVRAGGRSASLILAGTEASRLPGRDPKYEQMLWALVSDRPYFEDGYLALFRYYTGSQTPSLEQGMKVIATWVTADPQSIAARLAQVQVDLGGDASSRDIEQELSRLFDDDPDDPELFRIMQKFYSQAGRLDALIGKLEERRETRPRDTDVVNQLVKLYAQQKRNAEASRLIDATRILVADDAELLYSLAPLYNALDQKQTTEDVLQQAVRVDPNHAGACNYLGFLWTEQGKNLSSAESLIRLAVAKEPDNTSFLDSLGWVLYKRGKFDDARQYLQQAVTPLADPDPVVLDHLGDTLYRLGKTDDARGAWKQSLSGLGDGDSVRDDLRPLRLQLLAKLKQADENKPVDVAGVPGQVSVVRGPSTR